MATTTADDRSCTTCHKLERDLNGKLKYCAKCPTTLYCSQECQKSDWKQHKQVCAGKQAPPVHHNPKFDSLKDLLGLENSSGLEALPEHAVYTELIDCFRLRCHDECAFAGNPMGIYKQDDPRPEFRRFLDLAESRAGLLPPWWNKQRRMECERVAVDAGSWCDINFAVEKSYIMEHYGDSLKPMKLRILGEKIYGKGFMML